MFKKGNNAVGYTPIQTRAIWLVLGAAVVIAGVALTVHLRQRRDVAPLPTPKALQSDPEAVHRVESHPPGLLGDDPIVGHLTLGPGEQMSSPPVFYRAGNRSTEIPDLSTPAVAVHTVLSLIDGNDVDLLPSCFANGTENLAGTLYPRYLGHPIELVDVIEEDAAAKVLWSATVHTAFSVDGRSGSPGESVELTTRLVPVDGLWKLTKLHE